METARETEKDRGRERETETCTQIQIRKRIERNRLAKTTQTTTGTDGRSLQTKTVIFSPSLFSVEIEQSAGAAYTAHRIGKIPNLVF